jgi:hypothetical protein
MTRRTRFVMAVVLTIVAWGGSRLYALTPQNQCSGDCSPCLGADDPFCNTTTLDDTNGHVCVYCTSPTGKCLDSTKGQSGNTSCKVVTYKTTVVSCTAFGSACVGTTVTP